jgi:hypothetical protein
MVDPVEFQSSCKITSDTRQPRKTCWENPVQKAYQHNEASFLQYSKFPMVFITGDG